MDAAVGALRRESYHSSWMPSEEKDKKSVTVVWGNASEAKAELRRE